MFNLKINVDYELTFFSKMYMAQSTWKGHFGWQSICFFLTNFDSFVLLTYQLSIEIDKKKKKVTYKGALDWGYIELSLSGLFQGFAAEFELKFCVTKLKSIWKTRVRGLVIVFLWLDIYWAYRKTKDALYLYDFVFVSRLSFHKIADFQIPSQLLRLKKS